jgi:glutaredoxin
MQENEQQNQMTGQSKPKRLNGILILAFFVIGLIVFSYKPTIARVHCTEEILQSKPEVIMLGTWWCPYCHEARRYLTENEISYCEYDIERSEEGEKLFNDVNGQAIPILIVDQYMMSGFDESRLEQMLSKARESS